MRKLSEIIEVGIRFAELLKNPHVEGMCLLVQCVRNNSPLWGVYPPESLTVAEAEVFGKWMDAYLSRQHSAVYLRQVLRERLNRDVTKKDWLDWYRARASYYKSVGK